jgi:hypothetical protein
MSERIFALLLRLYPKHFRARYGDESLQLLRDRLRDESGFFARLRLLVDLFTDTAVGLPRAQGLTAPSAAPAAAAFSSGLPSFRVLEPQSLRPAALVLAWIIGSASMGTFAVLLRYAGINHTSRLAQTEARAAAERRWTDGGFLGKPLPPPPPPPSYETPAPRTVSSPSVVLPSRSAPLATAIAAQSTASQQNPAPANGAAAAGTTATPTAYLLVPLSPADRDRIIGSVSLNLRQHYFDSALAQRASDSLRNQASKGADRAAGTGPALAAVLTNQLRDATSDPHIEVVYSATPLPPQPSAQPFVANAAYREEMLRQNCTIEKLTTLPGNIGYLKLNSFPDLGVCQAQLTAAMAALNRRDAVIFDLRENQGGFPATTAFIAGWLFDHREYWYNPREATSVDSWTRSPVAGSQLESKPIYVLTSRSTWSGAEQFSYDLRMLHRATIIGETTRGGAHAAVFHRIDDHYGIAIPETKPLNPFSDHDWEGVGVTPDIQVPAADALAAAEKAAADRLRPH